MVSLQKKKKSNEEEKEKNSPVINRFRTPNASHGEPALLILRYLHICYRKAKVLIIYLLTAGSSVSFSL